MLYIQTTLLAFLRTPYPLVFLCINFTRCPNLRLLACKMVAKRNNWIHHSSLELKNVKTHWPVSRSLANHC